MSNSSPDSRLQMTGVLETDGSRDFGRHEVQPHRIKSSQWPTLPAVILGGTKSLVALVVFSGTAICGGGGVGLAWQFDQFWLLGILGIGIFLTIQATYRSLLVCLLHGILTGYVAFAIANPWMTWTIEGLLDSSPGKSAVVIHGVHLLHGGFLCLFAGIWNISRRFLWNGWLAAPAIWLILESFYPSMFPMRQGCLLVNFEELIQITSVFGVPSATLQVLLLASLMPILAASLQPNPQIQKRNLRRLAIAILLLTSANYLWGSYRVAHLTDELESTTPNVLTIGLVQGDTEYAQYHQNMSKRSRELAADGCDLVVWPECSFGKYDQTLLDFSDENEISMKSVGMGYQFRPLENPNCHLLGGGYSWTCESSTPGDLGFENTPELTAKFVSAFLLDRNEQLAGRHDKLHLMPGGEYVPGSNWFPALGAWLVDDEEIDGIQLSKGTTPNPIGDVNGMKIGALLCCEDMYPGLSARLTNQGADLLICMANGMSFDTELPLKQHFNIARFRAIENNRYFLRCGSYGKTCVVSPTGKVVESLPYFEELDLKFQIPIQKRQATLFSKCGDLLTPASYLMLLGLCLATVVRRRSNVDDAGSRGNLKRSGDA